MKCCTLLTNGTQGNLPFDRVIATGYYDGPIEGFTECSKCRRTYSFRKLDWDALQDVRVFSFAHLPVALDTIVDRLLPPEKHGSRFILISSLSAADEDFVQDLLRQPASYVGAFRDWLGPPSGWRNVAGLDLREINDWFTFLGIPKRK
jgi:hypothetical protein